MIKNLAVASDHAGYKLKQYLIENLKDFNLKDFGTNDEESCDFPDFASKVCDLVLHDTSFSGLLICGSGVGMSIAANKFRGIRAANVVDVETAKQSVEHNDVNVLCVGSKNVNKKIILDIIESFLEAKFIQKERYIRRISKLEQ